MTKKTNFSFYITDILNSSDGSVSIWTVIETWETVELSTETSVLITYEDNPKRLERTKATATGWTITFSKRWLTNTDSPTESSSLKKDWRPWAICYVTSFANDEVDLDADNVFTGKNGFQWWDYTEFATTAARDSALWWNWSATQAYKWVYVAATWLFYNYNLSTAEREPEDSWTVTPNAETWVTGKVRLSEQSQHDAWTTTESWNPLVPQSDVIQTGLQKGSATYASTVTSVYTPAFLTGWSSAQNNAATWAAVTNGSFRITVDWTAYNVDWINFTGDASMADVAATIQAALRAVTSWTETVVWSTDHFVITSWDTSSTSAISVLTTSTGTVGTDISWVGTAWMDAETWRWTVTNKVHASYTLNFTPALGALTAWMTLRFEPDVANDGAVDITCEALTIKNLLTIAGDELQAGDLVAWQTVVFTYNGTNYEYQGMVQSGEDRTGWVESANNTEAKAGTANKFPDSEQMGKYGVLTNTVEKTLTFNATNGWWTTTIAHWLWRIPKWFIVLWEVITNVAYWQGSYDIDTTTFTQKVWNNKTWAFVNFIAWYWVSASFSGWWAITSVDATNITLTYTNTTWWYGTFDAETVRTIIA